MDMNNINMGSVLQTFSHVKNYVTLRFSVKMFYEEKCLLHNEIQYVVLRFHYNGNSWEDNFCNPEYHLQHLWYKNCIVIAPWFW